MCFNINSLTESALFAHSMLEENTVHYNYMVISGERFYVFNYD